MNRAQPEVSDAPTSAMLRGAKNSRSRSGVISCLAAARPSVYVVVVAVTLAPPVAVTRAPSVTAPSGARAPADTLVSADTFAPADTFTSAVTRSPAAPWAD